MSPPSGGVWSFAATRRPVVALPTSAALAVDLFSLGQMLRYMLTGLPPGLSYLEHLEKQGVLLPLLKAAVRVARGKTRRPPRLALSPAKLSAPAKELIAQLTSKDPNGRPSASALRDHPWLETGLYTNARPLSPIEGSFNKHNSGARPQHLRAHVHVLIPCIPTHAHIESTCCMMIFIRFRW